MQNQQSQGKTKLLQKYKCIIELLEQYFISYNYEATKRKK